MSFRKILAFASILIVLPLASWARNVSVVMANNDLVKGELVGMDEKGLYLKDQTDKTRFYPTSAISKVFDTDTQEDLTDQLSKPKSDETSPDGGTTVIEEEVSPWPFIHLRHRRVVRERRAGPPRPEPTPGPFHRGLNLGIGFSTGGHTPNNEIQQLWLDSVDPALGGYDIPSPMSVDLDLMYRFTPLLEVGVFGQYYPDALGNRATVSDVTYVPRWYGYDTYVSNANYDFLFDSYAYGLKVRLRGKPNGKVALALYGGRMDLASTAQFTASDDYGVWYQESYSGHAPYYRADLEFTLMQHYRGALLLQLGYQWAHMRNVNYTVTVGDTPGSGPLTSYLDGSNVDVDFSGFRAGLGLVVHLY